MTLSRRGSKILRLGAAYRVGSAIGVASGLGYLGFLSPAKVERPEHRNVDANPRKHELDRAKHEGHERGTGQISDEVDDKNLPESNDADNDAAIPFH